MDTRDVNLFHGWFQSDSTDHKGARDWKASEFTEVCPPLP